MERVRVVERLKWAENSYLAVVEKHRRYSSSKLALAIYLKVPRTDIARVNGISGQQCAGAYNKAEEGNSGGRETHGWCYKMSE